jgi:hypothetical protein
MPPAFASPVSRITGHPPAATTGPGGLDLELAFDPSGGLRLLQARPITTSAA